MNKRPSGFFQEDNGNKSMSRLVLFISLLAAIGFGISATRKPPDQASPDLQLVVLFLGVPLAAKTTQKFAETPRSEELP